MTKLDLLARAKSLGIKGRHDMSKADLETAVAQRESIAQVSQAAKETAAQIAGKPTRRGSNLNTPWMRKYYFVDLTEYNQCKDAGDLAKAPMQVQLMLKFMVERGITSRKQCQNGSSMAVVAVAAGYVKTVIEPHVLFAYYVRKMERLGLRFAGYNVDEAEDHEDEVEAEDEAALEAEADDEEGE